MANEFWDSFNHGYNAVNALREDYGKAKYAKTGDMNALMSVNPEMAQQIRARNQAYDQGQTTFQHQNALYDQGQQDRQAMMQAGQQAAGGDWTGAQNYALQHGQFEAAGQFQSMLATKTAQEKVAIKQHIETGLPFFYGLSQLHTPQERQAWAQQNAAQYGVDLSQWTPEDYGDASIQAHLAEGLGAKDMIELDMKRQQANEAPNGYTWNQGHTAMQYVPGGPADPKQIGGVADARAAATARHRAPKAAGKAKAGATQVHGGAYGQPGEF